MRELTFDDAFWRDLLDALREPGETALVRLAEGRAGYAELVEGLARDARAEARLIGGRPATAGKNPRLFLLLTSALLAREGVETLYLDLSSELRWLEMLLGADLKEGLVDHLQYDVAIERCTRSTAIDGLDVLTGGAYFLAGSPLEDAPAFRAALERLRGRYDAVVIAFPYPFDAAEAAGMPALCETWIAIEEGEVEAPVSGSERAVVRLVGDPQAAWDLARLSSAFLGPLPALLSGRGATTAGSPATGGGHRAGAPGVPGAGEKAGEKTLEDEEEVAFLRAFEGALPPSRAGRPGTTEKPDAGRADPRGGIRSREKPGSELPPPDRMSPPADRQSPAADREGAGRRGRWVPVAALVGVVLVALLAVGFLTGRFEPRFAGSGGEDEWGLEWEETAAGNGDGTVVALEADEDSLAEPGISETAPNEPDETATIDGEPAPYSLHVGSYQNRESGARVVRSVEETGQPAFLALVDLGDRGRWFRVYAGAFADSSSAADTLDRILADGVVEEGAVRRTPWAFRVSVRSTREAAEDALAELGVPAYVIGDGPAVVWAGAFRSEDEAAAMAAELEEAGVDATLTTRERPR